MPLVDSKLPGGVCRRKLICTLIMFRMLLMLVAYFTTFVKSMVRHLMKPGWKVRTGYYQQPSSPNVTGDGVGARPANIRDALVRYVFKMQLEILIFNIT